MNLLDQKYWESRYENNQIGWDLGKASEPIKSYFESIENKNLKILIPGAGNSHEGIDLFHRGFKNIYLLDYAWSALHRVKNQISLPAENFVHSDYFEHHSKYDVIIEQTFFCALEPRFRESYVKHTHSLLKDNGYLIGVLFNFTNDEGPPFGGSITEYKKLFEPFFKLSTIEPCYNSEPSRMGKELFIKLDKK